MFSGDFHTHTRYSDGRGSLRENVWAALKKGLLFYGVSDHGPANIGTGVRQEKVYLTIKEEARNLEKEFSKIKILVGAEANVISLEGDIDISREIVSALDFLIIGLHPYVLPKTLKDGFLFVLPNLLGRLFSGIKKYLVRVNTRALIRAIEKYRPLVISHPNLFLPVDLEELAQVCAKYGVALEINTGHNYPKDEIVLAALKTGAKLMVNSDAHYPQTVGELKSGEELLLRYNFPLDRVLNIKRSELN
ncbi:PHP domain-containing protein [Carboxydothermus hydrogenoformans]|uniref:PHP domain protein n=1 Tax=Carboxydothermus hydrogenoformans (strain ATCC BAA-161 / DSM 6008 / Z-2901) TaxID=246194 RepID=Q3AFE1_CARHZ|nr:PHP domain-containing protein [Carboxydothermus hydrogenoformans]ABB16204.1 PHP domain protein [Carboxydothermus hydrogenoformans Z-2901]